MELDKRFYSTQKVGGFDTNNILNNDIFIKKSTKFNLSFKLQNIEIIDGFEIMKLIFSNNIIARIMKYTNDNSQAVAIFDLVDDNKKEIILKTNTEYIGGLGIADIFLRLGYITQWEIPVLIKLLRGFIFGDIDIFKKMITKYNLKISKDAEWYLKSELGLDI